MKVFLFISGMLLALAGWIIGLIFSFRGEFQLAAILIGGGWISYIIGLILKKSLDY